MNAETIDWYQIITILVGSGVIGTFLTLLYNSRAAKRQEEVNMAQFRIKKIDEKYVDYMDLITYSMQLYTCLDALPNKQTKFFKVLTFRTALKVIHLCYKIIDNGGFLLANQPAETVLSDLVFFIIGQFRDVFKEFDFVKFRALDSNLSHDKLAKKIVAKNSNYKKYFNMFFRWLKKSQNREMVRRIKMTSKCISQLLTFELNKIYEEWYNKKFSSYDFLHDDAREYLLREHDFGIDPTKPQLLNKVYPEYHKGIN